MVKITERSETVEQNAVRHQKRCATTRTEAKPVLPPSV